MSNVRSSKILKLLLDKPNSNSEIITAGENDGNESPISLEAEYQWGQYKTMFGHSFNNSTGSIDSSFVTSNREVISNPAAILPSTSSSVPNKEVPLRRMDSEPCAEEVLNESADIIEPSFDMTPIPSPNNDFLECNMATSTPLFRNSSICDTDNCSSSSASRANTPQHSNVSSQDSDSVCSSSESTPSGRVGRKRNRRRDEWKDIKRKYLKKRRVALRECRQK